MSYIGQSPENDIQVNEYEYIAGTPSAGYDGSLTLFPCTYSRVVHVTLNGLRLASSDFTATTGVSITLTAAAMAGDIVKIEGFTSITAIDGYTQAEVDTIVAAAVLEAQQNDIGFKNYIFNPRMKIQQYSDIDTAPVTMNEGVYYIDRFKGSKATVGTTIQRISVSQPTTINSNSLKIVVTSDGTGVAGIRQIIEHYGCYSGVPITISAWVKSNSAKASITYYDGGYSYSSGFHSGNGQWELLTLTCTPQVAATGANLNIRLQGALGTTTALVTGEYIEVTMVQLEAGSVATAFENRPVGLELSLCQRYFEKADSYDASGVFWSGDVTGGLTYYITTRFTVPKRTNTPTVTLTGTNQSGLFNTPVASGASMYGFRLEGTTTANGTAQYFRAIWTASAEL